MIYWLAPVAAVCCAVLAVLLDRWSDGGFANGARGGIGIVGVTVSILAAVVLVGGWGATLVERAECRELGEEAAVSTQYKPLTGCYVQTEHGSVPYERWIRMTDR